MARENNANEFFGLFGPSFRAAMLQRVKGSEQLAKSRKAFMTIESERNRLVHEDSVHGRAWPHFRNHASAIRSAAAGDASWYHANAPEVFRARHRGICKKQNAAESHGIRLLADPIDRWRQVEGTIQSVVGGRVTDKRKLHGTSRQERARQMVATRGVTDDRTRNMCRNLSARRAEIASRVQVGARCRQCSHVCAASAVRTGPRTQSRPCAPIPLGNLIG